MGRYFSTFIPGLGEVVQKELKAALEAFQTKLLLDGLIVYETNSEPDKIKNLRFLNNSFVLIVSFSDFVRLPMPAKTFRVIISVENNLTRIPKTKLLELEKTVSSTYQLKVDRANPDIEFWSLARQEGQHFFGIRITKHPDYKTVLAKGQLRPELANLLCLISDPRAEDIFLDPFSGSGAIAQERKLFLHNKIISGDIEPKNGAVKMDATNLLGFARESVNKIVTDPPWGISVGKDLDLTSFYEKMLAEFFRVLKTDGLIVILVGKKELFEAVFASFAGKLEIIKKFDILVSGKKATIYKVRKFIQF